MTKEETRRDKLLLATIKRSDDWPKVKRQYKRNFDECIVCGARKNLTVHHKIPYHVAPELELDMSNMMTLCEEHHLMIGHLNDWKSMNPDALKDAQIWRDKIKNRSRWR